jgi:CRISPR/Cas system-associated endonuclease Cas1
LRFCNSSVAADDSAQSQVQITLVAEGYDHAEIMHSDRDDAPAFVFDLMEPERPKIDRAVLGFLKLEASHPADFSIRDDRVARLIWSWRGRPIWGRPLAS